MSKCQDSYHIPIIPVFKRMRQEDCFELGQPPLSNTRSGHPRAHCFCASVCFQPCQHTESVSTVGTLQQKFHLQPREKTGLYYTQRKAVKDLSLRSFQIVRVSDCPVVYLKCLCPESAGLCTAQGQLSADGPSPVLEPLC